jgi:predicted PurR-regulated permease PerM
VSKLGALADTATEGGLAGRLGELFAAINAQLQTASPNAGSAAPVAVEVVETGGGLQTLTTVLLQVLVPVGTAGLVIVVVIFMLMEQDELRDRFIRLFGSGDIHATTQLLEDAARRVGNYLLTQLLVNVIYAVPIGIGLWLIGVPNAMLWGLLTLVLRFVQYIGPVIAAGFPMLLAFAVSPDWSLLLWTIALFATVELVTSNFIEPWLYGARSGVTPLAIIVAAIFWTWIWGPMGLILSTPLTVLLVVLGRHIPQFQVFDILFGDQPVLEPHARLYQRLLVGDVVECTVRAEEALAQDFVADWHRDTGIPALLLAQSDFDRGVLSPGQEARLVASGAAFLAEIAPVVAEERETMAAAGETGAAAGRTVLSIGGRSPLDDLAAAMLAQAAEGDGATATALSHLDLTASRFDALRSMSGDALVLSFLAARPTRGALLQVRRLKQALPSARVGVVLWAGRSGGSTSTETVLALGADFCVQDMDAALEEVARDTPAIALKTPAGLRRSGPRRLAVAS